MAQTHHRDSGKSLVINNVTDEDGFLKIFGKGIDVIILGDSTHEGGDVSIYEDASNHKSFSFDADTGNLILGNTSSETASLQIFGKNADGLILGDATHEGGDIKVYRDGSNNLQLSLDADAASNALALSVYGGVVAQNFLTVGQTTLNTSNVLHVAGRIYGTHVAGGTRIETPYIRSYTYNDATLKIDIPITGTDSTAHTLSLQIDGNNILAVKATGDGAGGIDAATKAIGLYGGTPTTQAAAISDPAESIAGNNAAIDAILVALRNISLIAT